VSTTDFLQRRASRAASELFGLVVEHHDQILQAKAAEDETLARKLMTPRAAHHVVLDLVGGQVNAEFRVTTAARTVCLLEHEVIGVEHPIHAQVRALAHVFGREDVAVWLALHEPELRLFTWGSDGVGDVLLTVMPRPEAADA
jgi:hypothetical protein